MVTRRCEAEGQAAAHRLAMSLAQGPSVKLGYINASISTTPNIVVEACFDAESDPSLASGRGTADHHRSRQGVVEKRKTLTRP